MIPAKDISPWKPTVHRRRQTGGRPGEVWCPLCGRWQPPWFRALERGALVRSRTGPIRIVRHAHFQRCGCLWGITLVIQRCSWTRRCLTVLTAADLKTRRFRRVPGRWRFTGAMDALIDTELTRGGDRPDVTCCDVEGLA